MSHGERFSLYRCAFDMMSNEHTRILMRPRIRTLLHAHILYCTKIYKLLIEILSLNGIFTKLNSLFTKIPRWPPRYTLTIYSFSMQRSLQ